MMCTLLRKDIKSLQGWFYSPFDAQRNTENGNVHGVHVHDMGKAGLARYAIWGYKMLINEHQIFSPQIFQPNP
jgi:hypothetical protein